MKTVSQQLFPASAPVRSSFNKCRIRMDFNKYIGSLDFYKECK